MRANLGRDAAILDGIVPLQDPLLFDREFNIVWRKIDEFAKDIVLIFVGHVTHLFVKFKKI